jgi:GT2 family glycosyltransferase
MTTLVTSFSASIVLYENDPAVVARAVQSTLDTPHLDVLYLIDNSAGSSLRSLQVDARIRYEHVGRNIGFGAGHNRAIAASQCAYHAIINPDVEFAPSVIPALLATLAAQPGAAIVGPALSSDGSTLEHWCRARPTPFDLLARRFLPADARWMRARQFKFERRDLPRDRPSDVDVLSGAFLVCDTSALRRLGGFDQRYFLYLEDYDLCRSALAAGLRCIHDPRQLVIHRRGGHSYSSMRPLLWHARSAIQYFNKWGWRPLC